LPGTLAYQNYTVYQAFCDPSGGRIDAFTLELGHYNFESAKYLVDHVEIFPTPLNPTEVGAEICQNLKAYRIRSVTRDKYAGQWVSESFGKHGTSQGANRHEMPTTWDEMQRINFE
jgi:hypothetical protein